MKFLKESFGRYRGLPREIYILFVARVVNHIGAFVYPLLTLMMTDRIGLSETETGFYMMLLALVQIPAMSVGGRLTDLFGRKKLILLFQSLGAFTYFVCGFVPTSIATVYLVMLASTFFTIAQPAMEAVTCDITDTSNRKEAFSMLYMGLNLGFAIGPVIAGLLYKNHMPWIFFGDALTTLLSTLLFAIFIKETKPQCSHEIRSDLEKFEEGSVLKVLLKRPIVLVFSLIYALYSFSYAQCGFGLPLYMKELFGVNGARNFGLVIGLNGLVVILLTPIMATLTRKFSSLTGMILGGLLYAVGFGAMALTKSMPLFYFWMFVLTIGEIVNVIDSSTFIANYSPASHRGRVNSVTMIIRNSGRAVGPLVMGAVIASRGMESAWYMTGLVVFVGALLMLGLKIFSQKTYKNKNL